MYILVILVLVALAVLAIVVARRKLPTPKLTTFQLWGLVGLAAVVLALVGGKLLALIGAVPAAAVWAMRLINGIRFARRVKQGFRPDASKSTIGHKEALEVLGLAEGATAAEIETAYRRLAKKLHPDGGGNEWQFRKLRQAYETLGGDKGGNKNYRRGDSKGD